MAEPAVRSATLTTKDGGTPAGTIGDAVGGTRARERARSGGRREKMRERVKESWVRLVFGSAQPNQLKLNPF